MKRVQLIEIGILAVVLIFGFRAIETILNLIVYTLYSFYPDNGGTKNFFWLYFIELIIYFTGFIILLKKRKQIAVYITGKGEENESVPIRIQKTDLLYIIIIAICITNILSEITTVLLYAFDYFKEQVSSADHDIYSSKESISLATFKADAIKLVLNLVLLYFAKPLSHYLSPPNSSDQPLAETENEH